MHYIIATFFMYQTLLLFVLHSRNRETSNLMKQIEMMKAAVAREEEKSNELEIKSKSVS